MAAPAVYAAGLIEFPPRPGTLTVEPFHLFRYLDDRAYRDNNRKDATAFDRFRLAAAHIVGRRITWGHLTGRDIDTAAWTN